MPTFTQNDILQELDLIFTNTYAPSTIEKSKTRTHFFFFLDLEHGYFHTADSRIHLYADTKRWAVIFEKIGYNNRGFIAEIDLNYIGNCVAYVLEDNGTYESISNTKAIYLIDNREFNRIQNKVGSDMEQFELIAPEMQSIRIRKKRVPVSLDADKYEQLGIKIRNYENPRRLIDFESLVRYLAAVKPASIRATAEEIRTQLPKDLPKLMTINGFHHLSVYDEHRLPSQVETYQLIANILVHRNPDLWRPTLPPNNHWSNWESGHL
ncbi:MAG: hypothetical protein AAGI23_07500 [Bacteroidota bacterium]